MPIARSKCDARPRRWLLLVPLLLSTFTSTVASTVVNVPLAMIMVDLQVPLSRGVLIVVAFNVTFAALMPVAGWLGEALGHQPMVFVAMVVLAVGTAGSALAPNLGTLVATRAVQGLASALLLPNVMALIMYHFETAIRPRALGAWAAVNGAGQSIGPVLGAMLASWVGWRAAFWSIVPAAVVAAIGVWRLVPRTRQHRRALEWRGACLLTVAAFLCLGVVSALPSLGAASPAVLTTGLFGVGLLVILVHHQRRRPDAFLPVPLLVEPRYLRSCVAVMAQMFCFGATLVGVPLFLILQRGMDTAVAGFIVLALPVTMLLLAPLAGLVGERYGLWRTLRVGLASLTMGQVALLIAVQLTATGTATAAVAVALALFGVGVAVVQTLAATGATGSPAGRIGSAIGLFNLLRFAAAALGGVWPALAVEWAGNYGTIFGVGTAVGLAGMVGTLLVRQPEQR